MESNCLSVIPKETPFGRKRQIDQHSCNKDYSCLNGFCPSFVTVTGDAQRSPARSASDEDFGALEKTLRDPAIPTSSTPSSLIDHRFRHRASPLPRQATCPLAAWPTVVARCSRFCCKAGGCESTYSLRAEADLVRPTSPSC